MKIVTDVKELKKPINPRGLTKEEVDNITDILTTELEKHKGWGLSTIQLGITDVRACIINVIEPMVLINPKILDATQEKVVYNEGCLSLPKTLKKPIQTIRHEKVIVECDNLGMIEFKPDYMEGGKRWENERDFFEDEGLLECVCIQHEIDHLNGKLITDKDRRYTRTITAQRKYGRNERVMVKLPDGKTEFMKYKKAIPLIEMGAEIL